MATQAHVVGIADALVAAINSATFSHPYAAITAIRSYAPRYTLEELTELKVTVIPPGAQYELTSRSQAQADFLLAIGIQQRTDGSDETTDQLILLAEEMAAFVLDLDFDLEADGDGEGEGVAHATAVEFEPFYDPGLLREERTFSSVLVITFTKVIDL